MAQDATHLRPAQVILAGLAGAAVFVGVLLFVVWLVTH